MRKGYSALEDVPMVVPIALALILFFSSLSWAINTVNSVNRRVDMTLAMIRIADVFAQWGVLTDETWDTSCNVIKDKEKDVYFLVYLVKPTHLNAVLNNIATRLQDGKSWNVLGSGAAKLRCQPYAINWPKKSTDVYVRFFPVTYQQTSSGGVVDNNVMFLVVVTWPKE